MWRQWKTRVAQLKQEAFALYLAARDSRVPWAAKIVIAIVVAYALSPIDLIPDFVSVLGYLDDLILLPLGIALAIKLIPEAVWQDCKKEAQTTLSSKLPRNRTAAIVIVLLWLVGAIWLGWIAWQVLTAGT